MLLQDDALASKKYECIGVGVWSKHNSRVIYHPVIWVCLPCREVKCVKSKFPKPHKSMKNAIIKALI